MAEGPPVALFWGSDDYLTRQAALQHLQRHGVKAVEIRGKDWQGGEASDLATPSLWGERRALLVTGCQSLSQAAAQELRSYLAAPSPDALCMLTAVSKGRNPPALAKAVASAGGVVRQVALRRQDLPRWIAERAADRGAQISPSGAAALVDVMGEDPAVLDRSVEQLAAAFPGQGVGPAQVRRQFRGLGEQRIWDLCDRALSGRLPEALVILRSMLEGKDDPLLILGGIASRVRDLLRVKALPERAPASEAARAAGIRFDWQLRRYREQAHRFSMEEVAWLHERVVECDRAIKGGVQGDVVLPALVANMAGRADASLDLDIRVSR